MTEEDGAAEVAARISATLRDRFPGLGFEPHAADCTHPTWKAKTMRCATCDKPWGPEERAAVDRIIRHAQGEHVTEEGL